MNVFAAWTGVRWGELLAVEGWPGKGSPLQLPEASIATYAVDWQLRELGGVVRKSAPKDGSYRVLDLPPFLADLTGWAMDNRRETCLCPLSDERPVCKGDDKTPANYLFLGPKGGHPRRSNYADDFLTPAAEGLHPLRKGVRQPVYVTAEPWPGIPIRQGSSEARHTRAHTGSSHTGSSHVSCAGVRLDNRLPADALHGLSASCQGSPGLGSRAPRPDA